MVDLLYLFENSSILISIDLSADSLDEHITLSTCRNQKSERGGSRKRWREVESRTGAMKRKNRRRGTLSGKQGRWIKNTKIDQESH